mmetsp:Transcript_11265/g.21601  ORF Transcript_11265/g.21601 Transcript_11265/m.21601 type:complete len:111 (-) Transcript_11265:278-610(-)
MILTEDPSILLCETADEAIMWELAIKACLLHEKTREEEKKKKDKQNEVRRLSKLMQQKHRREREKNQKGKNDEQDCAVATPTSAAQAVEELALKMKGALEIKPGKDYGSA